MTREEIYGFITNQRLAVLATISPAGTPEAALVGIAVTKDLEIVFDTVKSSRKYSNLIANPGVALVIGWENETTLQFEGEAEELEGALLKSCKEVYFRKFPDGPEREKWPGIVYFRVRPRWLRYSDYNQAADRFTELTF